MRAFRVTVEAKDEDAATAGLWEAGTAGLEIRPASGGRLEILAYFQDEVSPETVSLACAAADVEPVQVPDVDWVARFRETFSAFEAGAFRIAPVWDAPAAEGRVIVVDPGRAFGTGTHETTRLCLSAIAELAGRRRLGRTLDLGSGTGLLAIAAERLGAAPVTAADLDPEATASSLAHARLNGARLGVVRADGGAAFRAASFDLVLANLMAPLLIERSSEIRRLVAPGGALVLSGLLATDVPEVSASYAAAGNPAVRTDGEWAALVYEPAR